MAVALIACSKGDDNNNVGNGDGGGDASGILLLMEERVNGQPQLKFEYDERNRVTVRTLYAIDGSIHTENFTYDSNDRLTAVARSGGLKEAYNYDGSDDVPASGTSIDDSGTQAIQFTYSQNLVTETHTWEDNMIVFTYAFDNNGNLTSFNTNTQGVGTTAIEFGDYDDKRSAYTHHPWSWKIGLVNNYQSVKISSVDNGTVFADQILKYTYNNAGYPVKAEVYDRATDELVETREYFYQSAN